MRPGVIARCSLGGVLMGLANLVPGVSGGTMLLASGVYPRFIEAIGDVTVLRLRRSSLITLGTVVVSALAAIVLLAGPVKDLVVGQRWVMYSLFVGLTLGGVPVVWRMIGKRSPAVWVGAAVGFAGMVALAVIQARGGGGNSEGGFVLMLLAGAAGASAMILPGVSGGYLLLVLGAYVPILAGIDAMKDAASARDLAAALDVGLAVILPVGLGVVIGVVLVSNGLKWLLHRYEKATLGVLLGLLIGAVAGLYPFQKGVEPKLGETLKAQTLVMGQIETDQIDAQGNPVLMPGLVFKDTGKPVEPDDWPTQMFAPGIGQIAGSLVLIVAGLGGTLIVDRIGRAGTGKNQHTSQQTANDT